MARVTTDFAQWPDAFAEAGIVFGPIRRQDEIIARTEHEAV